MKTIDTRIRELEEWVCGKYSGICGTQITRVLMDNRLCKEHGITPKRGHEAKLVWCLALGYLLEAKIFFYGDTIEDAIVAAENKLLE